MAGPKLTLDTNSFIYLFDRSLENPPSFGELLALLRYALDGKAEISLTTRVEADLQNDKNETRRAQMLAMLDAFPIIGTVTRFGVSRFNSGDVLSGPELGQLSDEIQKILFPGLRPDSPRHRNKINDIDHLTGHQRVKRDIFVTDDREIWRKRDVLREALGIIVMTPAECLAHIDQSPKEQGGAAGTKRTAAKGADEPFPHDVRLFERVVGSVGDGDRQFLREQDFGGSFSRVRLEGLIDLSYLEGAAGTFLDPSLQESWARLRAETNAFLQLVAGYTVPSHVMGMQTVHPRGSDPDNPSQQTWQEIRELNASASNLVRLLDQFELDGRRRLRV